MSRKDIILVVMISDFPLPDSVRSTLYSKKYGVTLARFTHHKNNVIYASTKEDGNDRSRPRFFYKTVKILSKIDTLRYLSIHDNKYIRYFRGHKKRYNCAPIFSKYSTHLYEHT